MRSLFNNVLTVRPDDCISLLPTLSILISAQESPSTGKRYAKRGAMLIDASMVAQREKIDFQDGRVIDSTKREMSLTDKDAS